MTRRHPDTAELPAADPLDDDQYRALAEFRWALRTFLRFSEDAARAEGLTPAQHQLLLAVRGWPGPGAPTVGQLAERLQSRPHSALELVRRAEEAGLVELAHDPSDARRQLVSLTTEGGRRLAALSALHRDELRRSRRRLEAALSALDDT